MLRAACHRQASHSAVGCMPQAGSRLQLLGLATHLHDIAAWQEGLGRGVHVDGRASSSLCMIAASSASTALFHVPHLARRFRVASVYGCPLSRTCKRGSRVGTPA